MQSFFVLTFTHLEKVKAGIHVLDGSTKFLFLSQWQDDSEDEDDG
jgi:hypothetical protein